MIPKGKILLIGGAEDQGAGEEPAIAQDNKAFHHYEVLEALIPKNKNHRIEVITTASKDPKAIERRYKAAFSHIGIKHVGFLDIDSKLKARQETHIKRIQKASVVFFSGGDQFRLATIIAGTKIQELLLEKYHKQKDFVIGGTSAGATSIPTIVLDATRTNEALLRGDVHTTSGLGLLDYCIVDTHFIRRGRFTRLAHAVLVNPSLLGIGLGEDSAMLIKNGSEAECYGSGMVIIVDAKNIEQTNITEQKEGYPVFVENLKVDILVKGCRYSLKERRMYRPAIARGRQS